MAIYLRLLWLRVGAGVAGVAGLALLARFVAPSVFGQYSLYMSVVGAASMVLVNWPNAALLRYGREEWQATGSLGQTLAARAALYAAGAGLALLVGWALRGQLAGFLAVADDAWPWIAAGILALPLSDVAIYLHQAAGSPLPYGWVPALMRTLFLAGVVSVPVAHGADWRYLVVWTLAGPIVAAAFAARQLPPAVWRKLRLRGGMLRRMLLFSWALPFSSLAGYVTQWIDPWVLRSYMGTTEVGLYVWAYQVTVIVGFATTPLVPLVGPMAVDAQISGDFDRLARYCERALRITLLAAAVGAIGLALVRPALSSPIGRGYGAAYWPLVLLLSAMPFQLIGYLMNPIENASPKLVSRLVMLNIAMAAVNVAGDLALVPLLGISGPAIVTGVVLAGAGIVQLELVRRHFKRVALGSWSAFLAVGGIMPAAALALWLLGPLSGGLVCLGLGLGSVLVGRALHLFSANDVAWLKASSTPGPLRAALIRGAGWLARSPA